MFVFEVYPSFYVVPENGKIVLLGRDFVYPDSTPDSVQGQH